MGCLVYPRLKTVTKTFQKNKYNIKETISAQQTCCTFVLHKGFALIE